MTDSSRGIPAWCVLAFTLLPLVSGCGDPSPEGVEFRVEEREGIEHSVAADVPEMGDEGLERLWVAPGDAEVLDGTEWANPSGVAVGEDFVAVLDPRIPRVHVFGTDGARETSFGRDGEGPGELGGASQIAVDGDSIVVFRFGQPLQWFGRDGAVRSAISAEGTMAITSHVIPGVGIARLVFSPAVGSQSWEIRSFEGETHSMEVPGPHPMQPQVVAGEDEGCWRRGVIRGHLLEVDCSVPLLRLVDPQGTAVREHRIDRAPDEATEAMLDEAVERMRSSIQVSPQIPSEMVEQLLQDQEAQMRRQNRWIPVMRGVEGTPSGHRIVLWEQRGEVFGGGPAVLHVLDQEGRYLLRHEHEGRFAGLAVSDELIVVLVEDPETGLRQMEGYRLP